MQIPVSAVDPINKRIFSVLTDSNTRLKMAEQRRKIREHAYEQAARVPMLRDQIRELEVNVRALRVQLQKANAAMVQQELQRNFSLEAASKHALKAKRLQEQLEDCEATLAAQREEVRKLNAVLQKFVLYLQSRVAKARTPADRAALNMVLRKIAEARTPVARSGGGSAAEAERREAKLRMQTSNVKF